MFPSSLAHHLLVVASSPTLRSNLRPRSRSIQNLLRSYYTHSLTSSADMDKDQLPAWGDALSGSTGAVVANALVYPLDMYGTSCGGPEETSTDDHVTESKPSYRSSTRKRNALG